jgi:hypothetical protein
MRVFLPKQLALMKMLLENAKNESANLPPKKKTWKK